MKNKLLYVFFIVGLLLGIGIGYGVAYTIYHPQILHSESQIRGLEKNVEALRQNLQYC